MDATAATIRGAHVVAVNRDTNLTKETSTGDDGFYPWPVNSPTFGRILSAGRRG